MERLQQELQENVNNFSMHNDARQKEHSWGPSGAAAQQSPIRFQNVSTLMASREFQQTLIQGMQLQQQVQKSQNFNQQVQQNISVISSGIASRQQQNMQTSHLNVSEDNQSKVFSSVAQSQKQLNDGAGQGDPQLHQFQTAGCNQQMGEAYHTTDEGTQSHVNNNYGTLNLNISNYRGSIMLGNNEHMNVNGFPQHQPAFQSVETLDGMADGFGEQEKAGATNQHSRTEKVQQEMTSQ